MPADIIFAIWSPKHKAYRRYAEHVALAEATHYTTAERALSDCPNGCNVRAFTINEISMKRATFKLPKGDA